MTRFVDLLYSAAVMVVGTVVMALAVAVQIAILLVLLPSRVLRARSCNYFGKVVGPLMMWLSRGPVTWSGTENLREDRPAIYISNHTSIVDIFLAIWLSPIGTVGVAKKQVIYYPFFGQMYWLSGHLRIDRGDSKGAVESLQELARITKENGLSIYIWPEGTRSRDGRLLPFKKGIVHLALQTGLPIVPVVIHNGHKVWEKNTLVIGKAPLHIDILPPVDTSDWSLDTIEEHLALLQARYTAVLSPDQQPLAAAA